MTVKRFKGAFFVLAAAALVALLRAATGCSAVLLTPSRKAAVRNPEPVLRADRRITPMWATGRIPLAVLMAEASQ